MEGEETIIEDEKLTYKIEEYEDKRIKQVKICKINRWRRTDEKSKWVILSIILILILIVGLFLYICGRNQIVHMK